MHQQSKPSVIPLFFCGLTRCKPNQQAEVNRGPPDIPEDVSWTIPIRVVRSTEFLANLTLHVEELQVNPNLKHVLQASDLTTTTSIYRADAGFFSTSHLSCHPMEHLSA
jgi:hypothetical protein